MCSHISHKYICTCRTPSAVLPVCESREVKNNCSRQFNHQLYSNIVCRINMCLNVGSHLIICLFPPLVLNLSVVHYIIAHTLSMVRLNSFRYMTVFPISDKFQEAVHKIKFICTESSLYQSDFFH